MKELIDELNSYFEAHKETILNDYFSYLKFKSISTDAVYSGEVHACAAWVKNYIEASGFTVTLLQHEQGYPCILAERIVDAKYKTVMFYGHYDVQPVDPIDQWQTEPFTPTVKGLEVFARGAQDNKGQSYYVMRLFKTLSEIDKLPKHINIKLLIEGEEECGSKSMPALLEKYSSELKADYLYIVDCGSITRESPAITLGCRGIITMTMTLTGSNTDLHSGEHGGIAYNPLHAIVQMLDSVRCRKTGKISIPGFYDSVVPVPDSEKSHIATEFDISFYKDMFDADAGGGEKEFTPLESAWLRPTLEINGISGGYAGNGFKTVIPAKATAKISCRLVPDQDPVEIANLVISHLTKNCPSEMHVEFSDVSTNGKPLRNKAGSALHTITKKAIESATGHTCINILSGGSIPITSLLAEKTSAETLFIGYGLPDDQLHAPNEHFGIDRIKIGHATIGAIICALDSK